MSCAQYINLTPHTINTQVTLQDGTIEYRAFPPSGNVARCKVGQEEVGVFGNIPIVRSTYGVVEGLPEPEPEAGHIYIVSTVVAQQCPDRADVVSPDTGPTAIRNDKGQVTAVIRFQSFFQGFNG